MKQVQKFDLTVSFEKARFTLFWHKMQAKLHFGAPYDCFQRRKSDRRLAAAICWPEIERVSTNRPDPKHTTIATATKQDSRAEGVCIWYAVNNFV